MIDATECLNTDDADIRETLAQRLKFQNCDDWMKFGSCIYTYEDAALAIRGYFSSSKNENGIDIEYLRLFGFLNAAYLQLGAIEQLCEITKTPGKNKLVSAFRSHELIICRNMLASHTVSFKNQSETQSITLHQISLGGTSATFMINETGVIFFRNFSKLYESWSLQVREMLSLIVGKFISTVYKPNPEKQDQFIARLEALNGDS